MNRKNIRVFAAEELGLKTSGFEFVTTLDGLKEAGERIGFPCVIKPVMSSSGHGQSIAKTANDIEKSWEIAKEARGDASELIVEAFVPFDYEITLLTVRNETGTTFCDAIGHVQKDGDFILSWQPMQMSEAALQKQKRWPKRSQTVWAAAVSSVWNSLSKGKRSISLNSALARTIPVWSPLLPRARASLPCM